MVEIKDMMSVEVMGIRLQNPVVVAAGPWSRGAHKIKESLMAGAGAVVTESIVSEPYPDFSPRYTYDGYGLQNIRLYSGLNMEAWLNAFAELKSDSQLVGKGKIIANIMAGTPSELAYMAKTFERAGADGLELGIACPMGEGAEILAGNPRKTYEYTKAVTKTANIPVSVKISQSMNNLPEVIAAVEKAGANGITAIDTVRCILDIDIQTGKPVLPTYGGYSGGPIRPMGIATVAGIAQCTEIPVFGVGGIETYEHLLQYMMVGASAAQIGTGVLIYGIEVISEIIGDLKGWMKKNRIYSLSEIQGKTLKELRSFEEIRVEPMKAVLKEPCQDQKCCSCVVCCLDQAIKKSSEGIAIHTEDCTGCGLCRDVCPKEKIFLQWA